MGAGKPWPDALRTMDWGHRKNNLWIDPCRCVVLVLGWWFRRWTSFSSTVYSSLGSMASSAFDLLFYLWVCGGLIWSSRSLAFLNLVVVLLLHSALPCLIRLELMHLLSPRTAFQVGLAASSTLPWLRNFFPFVHLLVQILLTLYCVSWRSIQFQVLQIWWPGLLVLQEPIDYSFKFLWCSNSILYFARLIGSAVPWSFWSTSRRLRVFARLALRRFWGQIAAISHLPHTGTWNQ